VSDMRIVAFSVEGFKSLKKLSLPEDGELGQLCCLIGANGAGKTTILQALDLLSAMFDADRIRDWIKARGWESDELGGAGNSSPLIQMSVTARDGADLYEWSGTFNRSKNIWRCTTEKLLINNTAALATKNKIYSAPCLHRIPITFNYQGSILSMLSINYRIFGVLLDKTIQFVNFMRGVQSLELLSPQLIKERAREGEALGRGGERLSAYMHRLNEAQRDLLLTHLQLIYPQVTGLKTEDLRSGWKRLVITEARGDTTVEIDARHASDGMLRALTILTELLCSPHPVILFDEIENGLYPELLGPLIKTLATAHNKQLFITTHSPLIINWMPAENAQRDVFFVFRDANDHPAALRFSSLPSVKADAQGPGEALAELSGSRLRAEALAAWEQQRSDALASKL
jgi:predicted ATPase